MRGGPAWHGLSRFGLFPFALFLTAAAPPLADAKAYVVSIYRDIPGDFDDSRIRYSSRLGGTYPT